MSDLLPFVRDAFLNVFAVTIPIVATVFILMKALMARFIDDRERSRYDDLKKEAVLSDMRASYEHRLADLTREMVATRARWEDANHLLVSGQRHQPEGLSRRSLDAEGFLQSYGIDPSAIELNSDKVFVLTPFSEEERDVYALVRSVCLDAGFVVSRGDESRAEGDILPQIIRGIASSQIVIANISSRNPNVFFELGIAMAIGKATLLISDTLSDVPFDLKSRRIIVFKELPELREKLTSALLQTVRHTNNR